MTHLHSRCSNRLICSRPDSQFPIFLTHSSTYIHWRSKTQTFNQDHPESADSKPRCETKPKQVLASLLDSICEKKIRKLFSIDQLSDQSKKSSKKSGVQAKKSSGRANGPIHQLNNGQKKGRGVRQAAGAPAAARTRFWSLR